MGLLLTRDFFFFLKVSVLLFLGPSLTRGRVCHVLVLSLKSTIVSQYLQLFTYDYNWSRYLVRWSDTIEDVVVTLGNVLLGYHVH
jgi:hypothetical protein